MKMTIFEQGPKLFLESIEILESKTGILPDEYREFLLNHNGGVPSPDCIEVVGLPGSPTDIQVLFGIERDVESSCMSWIVENHPDLIAMGLLPIARDSGGGLFCIVMIGGGRGEVIYREILENGSKDYFVAHGFSEFLSLVVDG